MTDLSNPQLLPYLLNRLVGQMNKTWLTTLRQHGITVQRWQVLSVLSERRGLRVSDLADMTSLDQPVLTRVVDQMVRDGLAARHANPDDSRSKLVLISDEGFSVFIALLPQAQGLLDTMYGDVPEPDKQQIMTLLTKLMSNLE